MHEYYVCYSSKVINSLDLSAPEYKVVKNRMGCWAADPFIVAFDDKLLCFAEIWEMKYGKGAIGVCDLNSPRPKWEIIIREPFHMSYPFVFKNNNNWYMCPETGDNATVTLYKSNDFPYHWSKCQDILNGSPYRDTTFFSYNEHEYGFTHLPDENGGILYLFSMDDNYSTTSTVSECINGHYSRPGGKVIYANEQYYRIGQIGTPFYGYGLCIAQFSIDNNGIYSEKMISEHIPDDFNIQMPHSVIFNQNKIGIHTYNSINNNAVIDVLMEGWSWNMILGKIQQKIHNMFFK